MRNEYLYKLTRMCGIHPGDIGRLRIGDFFILLDNIDAHIAALEKGGMPW